jgi:hypothetical protein
VLICVVCARLVPKCPYLLYLGTLVPSVPVKRGDILCLTVLVDYNSCVTKLAVLISDCGWLLLIVGAGTE